MQITLTKVLTEQEFIDDYNSEGILIDDELRIKFAVDFPDAIIIKSSCNGVAVENPGPNLIYQIRIEY